MAKPTKRGNSWEGCVNHKSQRYRRLFPTPEQASAWMLESKAKLLKGEPIDMGEAVEGKRKGNLPYTLAELVQHVYDTHWAPKASGDKSLMNAKAMAALLGSQLPVAKVTKLDIDKARAKLLASGNSPATVNRKVAALSKCLSEAEDLGIIERKPRCSRYKEAEHKVRRFTPDEERMALAFFERISHQDMADYVVLSLDTGMRQGEVLQLNHTDAQGGRVTVWGVAEGQRSKSGKSRTVRLTARAEAVLKRRAETVPGKATFPNLNKNQVAHYWNRMAEALNLETDRHFVPHLLRHEFCSRLASNGENAAVIQQLAGHSTMQVTQRYVHLFGGELDGAIDRLQDAQATAPVMDEITKLAKALTSLPKDQLQALLATIGD